MAVGVDHVVEVTWSTSLDKSAQLLGEQLDETVCRNFSDDLGSIPRLSAIAVGMKDGAKYDRFGYEFVRGQVELDLWGARGTHRSSEGEASSGGGIAATVHQTAKGPLVDLETESTLLINPLADLGENAGEVLRFIATRRNREIEILGEAIRLEIALA